VSTTASVTSDPLAALRWLDVILVVAATPFALLMGAPALGYVVGAAGWVLTRVLALLVERRAQRSEDPKTVAGLTLFTGLGRAWLLGLTILLVGLAGEREDGLTAAILIAAAFTAYLITGIATRPQRRKPSNT
jgi:peptidoglycan biosynthesis protein MviN/MurJ (putative lipid II flippase)